MSKGVKRKQSSAVNNLLYFMIVLAIMFILYMLYEEDIQSFLGKDKKEIVKQEVKQEQVVQSNDDWYFRNERFYQKYRLITEYIVDVKSPLNKVLITAPYPTHQKNLQYILDLDVQPQETRIVEKDGNKYFQFELNDVVPNKYKFFVATDVAIRKYDILTAKQFNRNVTPEYDLTRYLLSEKNINVESLYLKEVADNIYGSTQEELVQNILNYIQKNIKYTTNVMNIDAEHVIKSKEAFCTGFASLMTALCRIKKIPARVVAGNVVKDGKDSKHNWVEVYYKEYGWVTYDPTYFVFDSNNELKIQQERTEATKRDYFVWGYNVFTGWRVDMTSDTEIHNPILIDDTFQVVPLNN